MMMSLSPLSSAPVTVTMFRPARRVLRRAARTYSSEAVLLSSTRAGPSTQRWNHPSQPDNNNSNNNNNNNAEDEYISDKEWEMRTGMVRSDFSLLL